MELIPIKLPLIKKEDPLLEILIKNVKDLIGTLKEKDIIVIAEKVLATSQGRVVDLNQVTEISEKAKSLAKK